MANKRCNKPFDYQGLVISSCPADVCEEETDLILILKNQRERISLRNHIYGVSRVAFVPPVIEKNFDNIERAKNLERRFGTPLKFGDVIQFDEEDVNHAAALVHRFHREKPMYEVSSNENGSLLKMGGCIEPRKPTTFWTPLDSVSIPIKDANRAEPDVWLYAYIKVETFMRSSQDPYHLELTFDSFCDFDVSEQARVAEAPWHRLSKESSFGVWKAEPDPAEDDLYIEVEPKKDVFVVENQWAEKIQKQLGLFVGERLLICKDLLEYDFIIPLLRPIGCTVRTDAPTTMIFPSTGEYFHFSAVWSNHHNAFLITEMVPVPLLRAHAVYLNGNLLVRATAAGLPGLFVDVDGSLGLMDDPNHNLALFEFHPACYDKLSAIVEVRAVRASENRSVRYRIVKVVQEDENICRYGDWLNKNEFAIGPLNGVVINRNTVICSRYPNVYFSLSKEDSHHPIGSGVRVFGKRIRQADTEIFITEANIFPEFSIRKVVESKEVNFFQIDLKPIPGHPQLARSDHFGLVDTRDMDPPEVLSPNGTFLAWVRESPKVNNCRRASTMMEVVSLSRACPVPPMNKTPSTRSGADSPLESPSGSSHGSVRSSQYSIAANRFVGPGLIRQRESNRVSLVPSQVSVVPDRHSHQSTSAREAHQSTSSARETHQSTSFPRVRFSDENRDGSTSSRSSRGEGPSASSSSQHSRHSNA